MANWPPAPTWANPVLVDERTGQSEFNPIWLDWFLRLQQLLSILDAASGNIDHNLLGGLQGGQAGQYYHLTATQHTTLTNLVVMKLGEVIPIIRGMGLP